MSGVIEEMDPGTSGERHDEALQNLLAQHSDDPQRLLSTVFEFLRRNTPYLSQPNAQRRVGAVLQSVTGAAALPISGVKTGFFGKAAHKAAAASSPAAPVAPKSADPAAEPAAGGAVSGSYGASATGAPAAAAEDPAADPAAGSVVSGAYDASAAATPAAAATSEGSSGGGDAEVAADEDEAAEGKGLEPNAGNGYDAERYTWTQTLADATVSVPVPLGTKGRACEVTITRATLKVGLKGEEPILAGDLAANVQPDDCMWNLADSKMLEITLAKSDAMRWWPHVLKGEPELNLQKVEPENSRISDLDGDTRATVEKMMYDQQQKQRGLPTADEQKKQGMLQKFMDAHPEMDFSKAKFS